MIDPADSCGQLTWKIRAHMDRHGILSVSDLHRRLKQHDPGAVNLAQFSRFVESVPARISARTLLGLSYVFGCEIGDMIEAVPNEVSHNRQLPQIQSRIRRQLEE